MEIAVIVTTAFAWLITFMVFAGACLRVPVRIMAFVLVLAVAALSVALVVSVFYLSPVVGTILGIILVGVALAGRKCRICQREPEPASKT